MSSPSPNLRNLQWRQPWRRRSSPNPRGQGKRRSLLRSGSRRRGAGCGEWNRRRYQRRNRRRYQRRTRRRSPGPSRRRRQRQIRKRRRSRRSGHTVRPCEHEEVLLRVSRVFSEVRSRPGRDRGVETSAQAPRGLRGQPLRCVHLKEAWVVMRQGPRDPDVNRERLVFVAGEEEEAVRDLGTYTEEDLRPQQLLQEQLLRVGIVQEGKLREFEPPLMNRLSDSLQERSPVAKPTFSQALEGRLGYLFRRRESPVLQAFVEEWFTEPLAYIRYHSPD